jgi:oxaloacetate decarboxylase gamma subunit
MEPSFTELLIPGLKLMLVGMGIVFLFLSLLVWIIGMTAKLVKNVNPPLEQVRRPGLPIEADEAELVAAIAVALRQPRGSNGR